jgi:hypothetical protein
MRSLSAVLTTNVPKRVVFAAAAVGSVGALGGAMLNADTGGALPGEGNYRFFASAGRTRWSPAATPRSGAASPPARVPRRSTRTW